MFGSEGAMRQSCGRLNESPSEKEGKFHAETVSPFDWARVPQ